MTKKTRPTPSGTRTVKELLSELPATHNHSAWHREQVIREAFDAAQRVFDKHVKGQLGKDKMKQNA